MRTVAVAISVLIGVSQGAADRWLGSWDRGTDATIEIVKDTIDASRVRMTFTVATPRGCTGEAAGEAPAAALANSAITLKAGLPDETTRECEMLLKLTKDGRLTLDEGSCSALHGAACDFSGTYTR